MRIFDKDGKEKEKKREEEDLMGNRIMIALYYILKELLINLFYMILGFLASMYILRLWWC